MKQKWIDEWFSVEKYLLKKLYKPSFLLLIKLRVLPRETFFMIIRCFVRFSFTLDNCDRPVRLVLSSSPCKASKNVNAQPLGQTLPRTSMKELVKSWNKRAFFYERVWKGAMSKCCLCIFLSYHKEEVNINLGDKWTKLSSFPCAYQILYSFPF